MRLARGALVGGFFALIAVLNSYPLARNPSVLIGEHGDALFSVWRLAWIAHQIRADPVHLFDGNIFYPALRTLAYSDAILLPALVVAPFHWLGYHPIAIYNLTLLAAFVLNALAAYALVHRLTGSMPAGLAGGLVFGFAPFRFDHFDHLEMQFSFWLPLAALAWHRAVETDRLRDYLRVAAFAAAQVLSCIYYGIFLLTWLPVLTLVWFFRTPARMVKACAAMLLPALAVLVVYSIPYMKNRSELGDRRPTEAEGRSLRAGDFLSAAPSNVLYGRTAERGAHERHLFPGVVLVGLVIAGVWPPWNRVRAAHAAGLFLAWQIAAGFNGVLYPLLYRFVLPYRGLRVPARAAVLMLLGAAVLGGFGAARLLARTKRPVLARALAALIVGGIALEYASRPSLGRVKHMSPWYHTLRSIPDAILFEWPVTVPWRLDRMFDVAYMYRSIWHWRPLLNGYSGNYPDRYIQLLVRMRSFPDSASLDYLQHAGATILVLHEDTADASEYARAVDRLLREPRVRFITEDHDGSGRVLFVRLLPKTP